MNPLVEKLADALLYEGYMLYPYRPSSIKNQRRFNFGVLVPPAYREACAGTESCVMRTECLVEGTEDAVLDVKVRFLQMLEQPEGAWQQAVPQEVSFPTQTIGHFAATTRTRGFCMPPLCGSIDVSAVQLQDGLFRLAVCVSNIVQLSDVPLISRDGVLPYSLISTHTLLEARNGEFVSLLDPPANLRDAAAACQNTGTWPVLVGDSGDRKMILSSPIILYDYPQLAPESPGDLFDATEIDEILSLRILTLTDAEKEEMRGADERSRRILDRTEMLPEEHFNKLHGALRGMTIGKAS
jgi:hypothetical protein